MPFHSSKFYTYSPLFWNRKMFSNKSPREEQKHRFGWIHNWVSWEWKSLTSHLYLSSPINGRLYKELWKTKSRRRVNVLIWIMIFGALNCSSVMQTKLMNSCLSPSICPLCKNEGEGLQHLFFVCLYSAICWRKFFLVFSNFLDFWK